MIHGALYMDMDQSSGLAGLDIYIRELADFTPLKRQDEIDLFKSYIKWKNNKRNSSKKQRRDGKAAYQKLIYHNLRLVIKIAKDYRYIGIDLEDLINEGNGGLIKAVERFDLEKGVKFSTYSSYWIKQHIRRAISNHSRTIRLPVGVVEQKNKINNFIEKFSDEHGVRPSIKQIAKKFSLSHPRVCLLLDSGSPTTSLDAEVSNDSDSCTLKDLIKDEDTLSPSDLNEYKNIVSLLNSSLDKLPLREKKILEFRYGLNGKDKSTLEEIGEKFGVTRERIRQLETVALRKIKYIFNHSMRVKI